MDTLFIVVTSIGFALLGITAIIDRVRSARSVKGDSHNGYPGNHYSTGGRRRTGGDSGDYDSDNSAAYITVAGSTYDGGSSTSSYSCDSSSSSSCD